MTDPDGAQAHGTRLCKEGGRPLWMQMSSGLQCAVCPSRCLHGAFPQEVGSLSGEIGSCPPMAVIVKVHGGGVIVGRPEPLTPWPWPKHSAQCVLCHVGCESTAGGGLSCPLQRSHPPALCAWEWPGVSNMVLLNPVSSGCWLCRGWGQPPVIAVTSSEGLPDRQAHHHTTAARGMRPSSPPFTLGIWTDSGDVQGDIAAVPALSRGRGLGALPESPSCSVAFRMWPRNQSHVPSFRELPLPPTMWVSWVLMGLWPRDLCGHSLAVRRPVFISGGDSLPLYPRPETRSSGPLGPA